MRYAIKGTWLEELYTPAQEYLIHRVDSIITDNNLLHKDPCIDGELVYKGIEYISYISSPQNFRYHPTYTLHPDLVDRMETYLIDAQELVEEHKLIARFLGIVLPKLSSMSDVKELFGDNLYNLAREHEFLTDRLRLSDIDIYNLSIEYRKYIDIMHNRMIDNLLAKDLYNADN